MKHLYIKDTAEFTPADAMAWVYGMQNEDGTVGGHWTMAETNDYKPDDISEYCWYAVMNMMYSDYCAVVEKYGISDVGFYADMARAFLMDKDAHSPQHKIAAYYDGVVLGDD